MSKKTNLSHAVFTRSDRRFAALIGERGALGYGLYWMIIEMLHEEESMSIPYNEKQIRIMAAQTNTQLYDFNTLLEDLIKVYDLLAVKDRCIVSTIAYRKPKKPKAVRMDTVAQQPDTATNTGAATAVSPAAERSQTAIMEGADAPKTEDADMPPQKDEALQQMKAIPPASDEQEAASAVAPSGQYNKQQLQCYEALMKSVEELAPRVAQMAEPFTVEQAVELCAGNKPDLIVNVLKDMQRSQGLTSDFSSAYQAFKAFASGREYIKARPRRSWNRPKRMSTFHY